MYNTCRGITLWLLKIPLFSNFCTKVSDGKHTVKFCPKTQNGSEIFDCLRHFREAVTRLGLMTVQCPPVCPRVTIYEMVNGLSQNLIPQSLTTTCQCIQILVKTGHKCWAPYTPARTSVHTSNVTARSIDQSIPTQPTPPKHTHNPTS